jgi:nucleoside-triphosphatase THEP1
MIVEFLVQLVMELVRALLVEELSSRVREKTRRPGNMRRTMVTLHQRNRNKLLNKLLTDLKEDL